ncbi:RecQ family ATP-dependent DNA helicase [Virgibacillus necropolis]|uniref:ATP-dependent DNA helicase n=1 Tax=Virgibacillus necropolis TaxID=163877 RepID=A0A221MCX7_9BACI|nr:ATP-dependent DNA helicase RecQ [Virgibacillus necropolis]ASN05484.1 ATP-dependent DNA helicase [Virgibacillus necropolis]
MNKVIDSNLVLEDKLKDHFGFTTFRTGQKEIIRDVMRGKDVLGILPTGMGKSLCYQLPAKLLRGTTIVISPLISLMMDQVKQLKASNFKEVIALNSFINPVERKALYQHLEDYKLIYVSPELIQQNELLDRLKQLSINLLVIDEAHCISQWGHDFRPDYLRLSNIVFELNNPPILALSATATKAIQLDIKKVLKSPNMVDHIYPMDRENIIFSIEKVANDSEKNEKIKKLFDRIRVPTIIYFSSRIATEQLTSFLLKEHPSLRVAFYHGGMETIDRISVQQQFMNNQLDVICCTSAFGMGINKKDIRFIIHYHLPLQLESFIQEIGRAGRDGKESVSLLLYSDHDYYLPANLMKKELPTEDDLRFVFQQLNSLYKQKKQLPHKIEQMEQIFHLSEIQWRFLHYQFENHGMIKRNMIVYKREKWKHAYHAIHQFIDERLILKEQKLREMIAWIETESCLREQLYKGFQSNYTLPLHSCCSNCGFNLANWEIEQQEVEQSYHNWEEKLQALFTTGGKNA